MDLNFWLVIILMLGLLVCMAPILWGAIRRGRRPDDTTPTDKDSAVR